ncbi:hypothetical protein JW711_02470, partial [Candidatus Woesearchaeota archaeon]|nr:hypothetical protein [Candidatus Woesearchaeota archaeon]
MGLHKQISLLMVYLIVSLSFLPFINAEIYSVEIYGQDEAPGAIRMNDTLTIITKSLLLMTVDFNDTGHYVPMTCDENIPVECSYSGMVTDIIYRHISKVREMGTLETKELTVYLDEIGPTIDSATFTNPNKGVLVEYKLTDKANFEATGKCSGIKKVDLILDGKIVATKYHEPGVCKVNGTIRGAIPNYEGQVNSSAIMIEDYMGFKNAKSNIGGGPFYVEGFPPKINSKVDVYKAGTDLKITTLPPDASVTVDFKISVDEKEIGEYWADLTEIGGDAHFPGTSCALQENTTYICTFAKAPLKLTKSNPKVTFYVQDKAGNEANLAASLLIKMQQPKVTARLFATKPGTLENVSKVPGENATRPYQVDLYADLTYDSAFDIISIEADLKDLGEVVSDIIPDDGNSTNSTTTTNSTVTNSTTIAGSLIADGSCERVDEKNFRCAFSSVGIRAKNSAPKVNLSVVDEAGGKATILATTQFNVILEAGTVNTISTLPERCYGDICYLNPKSNPMTAMINTASMFNESNVAINGVKAACSQVGGVWECNATIPGSTKVTLKGEDDLHLPIEGSGAVKFVVDSDAPSLDSDLVSMPDCPTSSESLMVYVNVSESTSPMVYIKANTAPISEVNETTAPCTQISDRDEYECVLSVSGLKDQQINTNIEIIIEDLAGNQVKQGIPVSICVMSDAVPDFISSFLPRGTMPRIDKKVASKSGFNLKVPIGLQMTLADGQTYILERSQVSCSQTPGAREAYLINDESMTPIMMVSLHYVEDWDEMGDILDLNCSQEFMIRHGNVRYSNPEVQPIPANLSMFNQPLGTLDESFTRKTREIRAQLRALDQKIDRYHGIDRYMGTICDNAERLGAINNIIQGLQPIMYAVSLVLYQIPYTKAIGKAIWSAYSYIAAQFKSKVETFLWPIGWVPTGINGPGFIVKYTCTVYNCKLYDMNTWTSIGMSFAAHSLRDDRDNQPKAEDKGTEEGDTSNMDPHSAAAAGGTGPTGNPSDNPHTPAAAGGTGPETEASRYLTTEGAPTLTGGEPGEVMGRFDDGSVLYRDNSGNLVAGMPDHRIGIGEQFTGVTSTIVPKDQPVPAADVF